MKATLLVSCPDQPGIIARFSNLFFKAKANITMLEEHTEQQWFFMRLCVESDMSAKAWSKLHTELNQLASQLHANLEVFNDHQVPRVALLVTSEAACPQEILNRYKAGELKCKIPLMIGNRADLSELAQMYGIDFKHVSYDQGIEQAEQTIMRHLQAADIDVVVLARFMKVLSTEFVGAYANKIINIHHGFLPAFKGSGPYRQAWEHGVKVIGATAHFVTSSLDEGPIISQEVIQVTHQHGIKDMTRAGQDIERRVLLRAVAAFLDHKIILHGRRTVVFH
ncbi:MAG: formyltetrahydrofolate deformylase [Candidatus Saccharimonadales bacterium]